MRVANAVHMYSYVSRIDSSHGDMLMVTVLLFTSTFESACPPSFMLMYSVSLFWLSSEEYTGNSIATDLKPTKCDNSIASLLVKCVISFAVILMF